MRGDPAAGLRTAGVTQPPTVVGLPKREDRHRLAGREAAMPIQSLTPPSPTAFGACCLGSDCVNTDYFDCRELNGSFRENLICFLETCNTGACCTDPYTCVDAVGVDPMDEAQWVAMGGDHLGEAR